MNIHKIQFLSCIILVIFLFSSINTPVRAQEDAGIEYYVDGSYKGYEIGTYEKPYSTIQKAIDSADDGDTIFVYGFDGAYEEHIVIDKTLHLFGGAGGLDSVIELDDDKRYTVEITADYVEFQNFYLTDEHEYKTSPIGALISIQADNVVINENILNNTDSYGIHIDSDADGSTISGNLINNTKSGIYVKSATNDILNNEIMNCTETGIYLFSTSHNRMYDNKIQYCLNGVIAKSCNYINISNNSILKNEYNAIQLLDCTKPLIQYNEINENPYVGIYLDCDQGTIRNNLFSENGRGISLKSTSTIIHSNNFTLCTGAGLYAESTSTLNTIYNNTFFENGKTAEEHGDNTWYDETYLKGNYWDDYGWIDKDENGIGDDPYTKNGVTDPYPLGFFLHKPKEPKNPSPEDGETGVGLKPTLSIKVEDVDSDKLTVTFYNAKNNESFGIVRNVNSGKFATYDRRLPFNGTYAWYVTVNDTYLMNRSQTFFFTTMVTPTDNIPPVADIGGPYEGEIGEPISFDASKSADEDGEIKFYRWNFGDGTSEILSMSPTHIYQSSGTYTVTLTVIDDLGSVDTKSILVPIGVDANKPPTANPGGIYTGKTGSPVLFDGSGSYDSDGEIVEYIWSFGDNTTGSGESISHTYNKKGTYNVILTVTDAYGESHADSTIVTIEKKPDESPGFAFIIMLGALISLYFLRRKKQ